MKKRIKKINEGGRQAQRKTRSFFFNPWVSPATYTLLFKGMRKPKERKKTTTEQNNLFITCLLFMLLKLLPIPINGTLHPIHTHFIQVDLYTALTIRSAEENYSLKHHEEEAVSPKHALINCMCRRMAKKRHLSEFVKLTSQT